ncbi:MAG: PD-(D/E)XK nuclease family protein [Myxococcota bacterium]|nr:PD-(D/E)XK nuclease family protein [Myxococcota bacterium]
MADDPHLAVPGLAPTPAPALAGDARAAAPGRPRVWVGRGPRAVESVLFEALGSWSERVSSDFALLARPLRVVVPSRSLREHVAASALRALGRPLVGVSVQTLYTTALEVLERAGARVRTGRELYSLVIRRRLRDEPSLMAPLGKLTDAHRVVEASVDDLLDAGFGPEHAVPLHDALEAQQDGAAERALAIARIALAAREELDAAGLAHRSQLLERACDALERDPALLPTSELWIHGFAEATGRATDLLLSLAHAHATTLLLDEPAEPGTPERVDSGAVFAARLRERFEGVGGRASVVPGAPAPVLRELLAAPGAEAEVRAVAGRIRALLDSDPALPPERVGIVARQVGAYAHALRAHLGRLGIPFSGVGASVASGAGARRAAALGALLEEREACGADRWVELLRGLPGWVDDSSPRADLRLGLRHLGAGRLGDVAGLEAPDDDVRLPVRQALRGDEAGGAGDAEADDDDADDRSPRGPTSRHRRLRRAVLRVAVDRARSLCEQLAVAPATATVAVWDAWLRDRLAADLGWEEPECASAIGEGLSSALPDGLVLSRDEALALFGQRLSDLAAREPLGGRGGGVAVLGVMEARARTFDHLFVLGLNRDVFPRPIREDPLLPDAQRRPLLALLPDLPIKTTGHDEERYLFAQLLASSAAPVLSWQSTSDGGGERVRSTFVDRLCGRGPPISPSPVPTLHHPGQLGEPGRSTARELAIWAGIAATRAEYEAQLEPALREAGVAEAGLDLERVAGARAACVREYAQHATASFGPYLGFVGPVSEAADPRRDTRYVTSLERMAHCPWKTLLEKLLRLEAPPDPLESFPELDGRIVGLAVHRTLEEMLDPGSGERPPRQLDEVCQAEPRSVVWPAAAEIEALAAAFAREQLAAQGHPYPGLVRVLAARVVAHLARARELVDAPAVAVLGAEVAGSFEVPDGAQAHALAFRADLVERIEGTVRLTDYKTGQPVSEARRPSTRAAHFGRSVARGELLQAVVYALATGGSGDTGRYLFLKPSLRLDTAQASFVSGTPGAAPLEAAFRSAVSTLGRSWDAGVFLPRLSEVQKDAAPPRCGWCDLASACLRGDTDMQQRQRAGVAAARERAEAGELSELEARHLSLWDLPAVVGAPDPGTEAS